MATKLKPRKVDTATATKPKKAEAVEKPKKVNAHVEAGVNNTSGVTGLFNANRPVKILLDYKKDAADFTDRTRRALYSLRDAYGNKVFSPRGLDNGIMRDLVAAGIVKLSGGQETTIDGKRYHVDGEKPTSAKFTAAGMAYGKA